MKYERVKYPDGQISAKFSSDLTGDNISAHGGLYIHERINSYEDLIYVRSIAEALRYKAQALDIELRIPCLFGQRSDRRFAANQSFDLKIICDIINDCKFSRVTILDPHSNVCLALINNSWKESSYSHVAEAVQHIGKDNLVLVSPDAGAYKKVFEYGEKLGLEVVAANKHRDLDGKIDLQFLGDVKDKECLIVDDLCDGGYTFELLGKALKEQGAKSVFLYVSHGYFSKGFDKLKETIDHIYCTNSVKDIDDEYVTQFKVI